MMAALPRVMLLIREILFRFILLVYIVSTKMKYLHADIRCIPKVWQQVHQCLYAFLTWFLFKEVILKKTNQPTKEPPEFPKQE